ncbi:tRNA (adenosine(37)-N6)-dimethylallyltransferase MiaA [Helicobacter pullorum]|uniref:tRNA (adenosine(37)-N6)-dimethylallyltransferase MiaA n=1 Tax=Helicobacter pullorum TaxID=35818 RepID=UPI0008169DCF|nr:tRNA (adenosine(37)-N6)-dimethylallyltransferase MiaA [Helicobacter pullorum]OCR03974.1 tRNA (adenosine(37)-N6)-dimethylallyltransferase MiaA [Helicobacter pullorum]OCR07196.1 tRNA (adenosine(37)-N6)-dimethylallyltransferase MiaA [Helicobacter pullorum]OCR09197.1 tRNA (adenosine(37)-N6)-dimethylallyltransferase MiaA [Helicobacter pullorum]OCR13486.1 tRNA (adenosine(37)-N6)-dimethylallyltransferase MiaA [Helicobacter pullorum]
MKTFAILGSSGSGKTALSLEIAQEKKCAILSLDSLSVYREIDIISAKPTKEEMQGIWHFGIDILEPIQPHNVQIFIQEYQRAKSHCQETNKNLLIVGGTGFYLKMLLDGLSCFPAFDKQKVDLQIQLLGNLESQYDFLCKIDSIYAAKLKPTDTYRIHRALQIYFATQKSPTQYFKENQQTPIIQECEIYEITLKRETLRQRIIQRTQKMLENGAIKETENLIKKYGKNYQWAKSIGIKEIIGFLENTLQESELESLISTHTAQLAKRQRTFNKTQFREHFCGDSKEIWREISKKI